MLQIKQQDHKPFDLPRDICLTGEEKPRKNPHQEACPDRGSNPGPLRDRRACYCLLQSGGLNNHWTFAVYLMSTIRMVGRRVIGISGSLIWSKTLMKLIFNPCREFRWNPDGPVSQIHSYHLLFAAPGSFSDLLRFVQMLKREWDAESNGKLPHLFIPSKTATYSEFSESLIL